VQRRLTAPPDGKFNYAAPDGGDGTSPDDFRLSAFGTRVALTALVFTRGRGTGIAIAAAYGGSSSPGAA
jgi:hypothetical protein